MKFIFRHQIFFVSLLINIVSLACLGQRDTVYTISNDITSLGKYSAKDSIYNDLKNKKIHLYGDAKLEYNDVKLSAHYIVFDIQQEEVYATYKLLPDNSRLGEPIIIQNGEEIKAGTIRFNLKTKKGYIQEVALKQEEMYLQMNVAKRHPNEEVHFRDGMFTTCDLKEPHFHFHLSKAVLIPNQKIVSKKMNVYLRDISLPLGLPFLVIPQSKPKEIKKGKSGILVPKFAPTSIFGMGISDLGYYIPINDSIHTTFLANLYTSGSWALSNLTEYKINYKFSGRLNTLYQQNYQSFPHKKLGDKFAISWTHSKDSKSNPYWNFSASVNFVSDNNNKNTVNAINPNYLSNTLKSDINITRSFPNKPISMGLKFSSSQNSITKMMDITSPIFTVNVSRFSPTKLFFKNRVGADKWYDKINISYNLEGKNLSYFADSLIKNKDFRAIQNKFSNGLMHKVLVTSTFKLFKNTWSLTPSVNYSQFVNFQATEKKYDTQKKTINTSTIQQTGTFHTFDLSVRATSQLYTYYRFVGKKKALIRHILTPSFSYSYIPKGSLNQQVYYNNLNSPVSYSIFETSLYHQTTSRAASLFAFDFMNTFELKRKNEKDTLTGFKKTKIIDAFTLGGNYNFLLDSMRLSNINIALRLSPLKMISIVANSSFSPYAWDEVSKKTLRYFAYDKHQSIGRFLNASVNTTLTLTTRESRKKIEENKDVFTNVFNSDVRYFMMHPEQFIDFNIPWKLNITHLISFETITNKLVGTLKNYNTIQNISFNGDVSFTKRWNMSGNGYYDVKTNRVTNFSFTLTRNLHCWNLSFYVVPVGTNKSFVLRLYSNAKLLQDAKLELRKPPSVF